MPDHRRDGRKQTKSIRNDVTYRFVGADRRGISFGSPPVEFIGESPLSVHHDTTAEWVTGTVDAVYYEDQLLYVLCSGTLRNDGNSSNVGAVNFALDVQDTPSTRPTSPSPPPVSSKPNLPTTYIHHAFPTAEFIGTSDQKVVRSRREFIPHLEVPTPWGPAGFGGMGTEKEKMSASYKQWVFVGGTPTGPNRSQVDWSLSNTGARLPLKWSFLLAIASNREVHKGEVKEGETREGQVEEEEVEEGDTFPARLTFSSKRGTISFIDSKKTLHLTPIPLSIPKRNPFSSKTLLDQLYKQVERSFNITHPFMPHLILKILDIEVPRTGDPVHLGPSKNVEKGDDLAEGSQKRVVLEHEVGEDNEGVDVDGQGQGRELVKDQKVDSVLADAMRTTKKGEHTEL